MPVEYIPISPPFGIYTVTHFGFLNCTIFISVLMVKYSHYGRALGFYISISKNCVLEFPFPDIFHGVDGRKVLKCS